MNIHAGVICILILSNILLFVRQQRFMLTAKFNRRMYLHLKSRLMNAIRVMGTPDHCRFCQKEILAKTSHTSECPYVTLSEALQRTAEEEAA